MSLVVQEKVPLAPYTTLQVGGDAEYFADIHTESDIAQALDFAQEKNIPVSILGGGSNVLIADRGISGLVLHMAMLGIEVYRENDAVMIVAAAGEVLDTVIQFCVQEGYWGLENLSHIPGTVGAAPVQNVGAYGLEVQEVIEHVRVYDTQEKIFLTLSASECLFGYRDSLFKKEAGEKYIVCSVTFRVSTTPAPLLAYQDLEKYFTNIIPTQSEIREAVIEIRSKKFPDWHTVGTAGSFFKNPVMLTEQFDALVAKYPDTPSFPAYNGMMKVPLGWILDKILHLKDKPSGSVGVYKNQALVIVNTGKATATDIRHFADTITLQVQEKTGIEIQWEVTKMGLW